MSTKRSRWIALALVMVLGATAYFALRPATPAKQALSVKEPLSVPEGQAGKAGDVVVTEEAMRLAEIKVEAVTAREVSERLSVNGIIQAGGDDLVKVTPRVAGKVTKLLVGAGDPVQAGQIMALLESTDLGQAQAAYRQAAARASATAKNLDRQRQLAKLGQFGNPQVEDARTRAIEADRAVQDAEKDVAEERTKLSEALSDRRALLSKVEQARAELEVTKAQRDRVEALYREQLVSRQELERIQADYKKASADVDVAESAVAQGEARIEGGKQRLAAAETGVALARRRAAVTAQSLKREEKVYAGNYLTNREIVDAEAAHRLAQVDVQGTADAVRLLGGHPGGGNVVALRSPISGRVQERSATLGETIDPEHAAFTVVNLDRVWAQLSIPPAELGSVRVGDQIALTSETSPARTFRGTVVSIGTAADESTRAVAVRTTLQNSGGLLKPGSFVRGTILTEVRRERLVVPAGALQEHTGRPTLYVAMEGRSNAFEVRHVKLGIPTGDMREVVEGLKSGERIAISGTFYLKSEALKSSLSDGCCAPSGG